MQIHFMEGWKWVGSLYNSGHFLLAMTYIFQRSFPLKTAGRNSNQNKGPHWRVLGDYGRKGLSIGYKTRWKSHPHTQLVDFELSPTRKGWIFTKNVKNVKPVLEGTLTSSICMGILNKYDININQRSRGFRCEKFEGFLVGMRYYEVSWCQHSEHDRIITPHKKVAQHFRGTFVPNTDMDWGLPKAWKDVGK